MPAAPVSTTAGTITDPHLVWRQNGIRSGRIAPPHDSQLVVTSPYGKAGTKGAGAAAIPQAPTKGVPGASGKGKAPKNGEKEQISGNGGKCKNDQKAKKRRKAPTGHPRQKHWERKKQGKNSDEER